MILRRFRTLWLMPRYVRASLVELSLLTTIGRSLRPVVGIVRTKYALSWWSKVPVLTQRPADTASHLKNAYRAHRILVKSGRLGSTCLFRSLALWAMLRRRGIETTLVVGYRRTDGRVEGHVWVEFGGRPINEDLAVVATYTTGSNGPFMGT